MSYLAFVAAWRARHAKPLRYCGRCSHFNGSATAVEASFAGLVCMGSAYASVRADDGLCELHQIYLSARAICESFEPPPRASRYDVTTRN